MTTGQEPQTESDTLICHPSLNHTLQTNHQPMQKKKTTTKSQRGNSSQFLVNNAETAYEGMKCGTNGGFIFMVNINNLIILKSRIHWNLVATIGVKYFFEL